MTRDIKAEMDELYQVEDPFGYRVRNRWPLTAGIAQQLMYDRIGNFCEIGCGEGGLLRHLESTMLPRAGGSYAVEISERPARDAFHRCQTPVRVADALDEEGWKKLPGPVDLCVVSDFFERNADPEENILACEKFYHGFVNPGGLLLVTGILQGMCSQLPFPAELWDAKTVFEAVVRLEVYNRRIKEVELNTCIYRAYQKP
jgi:hypothetical protein